jgi:hypothetical protein
MERIDMSQEERDRLEWLKRAKDGVISQREAARRMGVTDRWVRKQLKRMKRHGDRAGRAHIRAIVQTLSENYVESLGAGSQPKMRPSTERVRKLTPPGFGAPFRGSRPRGCRRQRAAPFTSIGHFEGSAFAVVNQRVERTRSG